MRNASGRTAIHARIPFQGIVTGLLAGSVYDQRPLLPEFVKAILHTHWSLGHVDAT